MGPSLLRQRTEDDAAFVVRLALDLPLDVEDVLAAERHHRVAYETLMLQIRFAWNQR